MEYGAEIVIECLEFKKSQLSGMLKNPKIMGAPALVHFIRPQILEINRAIEEISKKNLSNEEMSEETLKWYRLATERPTVN
jgi:hypothetical protein